MAKETKEKIPAKKSELLPLPQLFRYASPADYFFMFCGTLSAIIHGATLPLMTIFLGDIITAVVTFNGTPASKLALDQNVRDGAIKMTLVGVTTLVFGYFQMTFWVLAGENQTKRIREKYFNSIIRQDIGWFDNISTGDLTSRLTADINKIQEGISDKFALIIQFLTTFIAGFVIAYTRGWQLALVLTGCLPILAGMATFMGKLLAGGTTGEQNAYGAAGAVAQQVLSSIKTVVAFGGEQREIDRYCKKLDDAEKFGIKKALINGTGLGSIQLIIFCVYGLAFWYGGTLVPNVLQPGTVLNVIFAFIIGAFSLGNATPNISAVSEAMGCAKAIFDTIERKSPIDAMSEEGKKPTSVKGEIIFKDIDFHYPSRPEVTVMKDFNLIVKPGTTVALVGSSGSGKSTAIKLFERFYDPVSGSVSLDGVDIKEINVNWLRQQIGIVSQEPCLFDATIRQNILLGLPDFDKLSDDEADKKIEIACKQANCWDFIQKLPLKFQTQVGEAGAMLSGGQKQRIAIARAIIKNPSILLLDEATSALDTESERIVQNALEEASKNRTTMVVAHRLSTIKNADVIVAMSLGKIVEQGSHEELIAKKGMYADLVEAQNIKTEEDGQPAAEGEKKDEKAVKKTAEKRLSVPDAQKTEEKTVAKQVEGKVDYGRLFAWNKQEYGWFFVGGLASLLNGASQPLFALLFSDILTILGTPRANDFALLMIGLGGVAFLSNLAQTGVFDYSNAKMTRRVREACFRTLLRQEMAFFDEDSNSTGNLTTKLAEDASLVSGLTGQTIGSLLQTAAGIITGLIIAFLASWQLALLVTGLLPLIGFASVMQMKVLAGTGNRTRTAYEVTNQKSNETIQNIRTIVTITQEKYFYETYAKSILVPHKMTIEGAFVASLGFGFSQSIMHFVWATSLYYGSYLMKEGLYFGGDILRAMFSIIFAAMAAGRVSTLAPNAAKAKLAALAIFELLDRKSLIDVNEGVGEQRAKSEGQVTLTDVKFNYPSRPDTKILKGLNLLANPGQTVALVGHSGCGKSTVMGLLLRWYDNTGGNVSVDSLEVQKWNLGSLRSFIGIVGQEPVLFDISIRDNIAYGAITKPDDLQIIEAAKAANIHDFVQTLPNKYDELVGERGGKMSGGQKQRIAIARALIRNPRVLLLDEATSALDSESEVVVQEALDAAAKGRTTLVIAHRLSTIQNADLILVVNQGVVVESGTHFELIKQNGQYADFVNQQTLK